MITLKLETLKINDELIIEIIVGASVRNDDDTDKLFTSVCKDDILQKSAMIYALNLFKDEERQRKRKIQDEEERQMKRKRKLELEHNEERKKERINDEKRKTEIKIPLWKKKKDLGESGNFTSDDQSKNADSNASDETNPLIDNVNIIFIN